MVGAVLVASAIFLGRFLGPWETGGRRRETPIDSSPTPTVRISPNPAAPPRSSAPAVHYSPLADQLTDSTISPEAEVRLVQQLFSQYISALQNRPGPPIGDNQDLVKVLTGKNPLKRPLLPPYHPRIDASGRLCDRWGRPFHLHAVSSRWIEVRSAGPDGALFTGDDVVPGGGDALPSRSDESGSLSAPAG